MDTEELYQKFIKMNFWGSPASANHVAKEKLSSKEVSSHDLLKITDIINKQFQEVDNDLGSFGRNE